MACGHIDFFVSPQTLGRAVELCDRRFAKRTHVGVTLEGERFQLHANIQS